MRRRCRRGSCCAHGSSFCRHHGRPDSSTPSESGGTGGVDGVAGCDKVDAPALDDGGAVGADELDGGVVALFGPGRCSDGGVYDQPACCRVRSWSIRVAVRLVAALARRTPTARVPRTSTQAPRADAENARDVMLGPEGRAGAGSVGAGPLGAGALGVWRRLLPKYLMR